MHFNGLFHYLKRPSTNRRIPRRKHSYRTRPPPVYTLSYKSWPLKIQPVSKTPFSFLLYYVVCTSQLARFFFPFKVFFCSFLSQYIFQARPQMSHGLRTQHVVQRPGISAWLVCYGTHYCGLFWPLFSTILLPWQLNFDPTSFTHRDVVKFRFSEKATKV